MSWFSVHSHGAEAFAWLGNDIGCDGPGADAFVEALGDASTVRLRIDSNGGDMVTGLAIADALRGRDTVATVDRKCFSSAVPGMLVARRRVIREDALVMVHLAVTAAYGGRLELRHAMETLAGANARLFELLLERTGRTRFEIAEWLRRDRYFTPAEAVAAGLADEIAPAKEEHERAIEAPAMEVAATAAVRPWTPAEWLLLDILNAVGHVDTHDRERLGREVGLWFQQNVGAPG
ncbi:MAG: ATP-dependent Clp protease proteolytic subunit [Verrucomicrobiales bacterium]|nr:ATP-dependent Clp protease proteolytic subunit [Verrucomicrobiales bacterium]